MLPLRFEALLIMMDAMALSCGAALHDAGGMPLYMPGKGIYQPVVQSGLPQRYHSAPGRASASPTTGRFLMNTVARAMCLLACAILLPLTSGCAHKAKKPEKPLSSKGLEAANVVARYLAPESWDEAHREKLAKAITPLEYHGASNGGKPIIHVKFEIPEGPLRDLLGDSKKDNPAFLTDGDGSRSAAPESHKKFQNDGGGLLSWWKPGKEKKKITHYFWSIHHDKKPTLHVWLQSAERKHGTRLVYLAIEGQ